MTPYLLYFKIFALVVAAAAIIGVGLYIKGVFAERRTLLTDNGRLSTELTVEKIKNVELLKQSEQIMAMNKDIIEAVKRVKINSSIYVDKVEASPLPAPAAGGTLLIPGGTAGRVPKVPVPIPPGMPIVNYPFTERAAASSP